MSNIIAPHMIVKRYTFDDSQTEFKFQYIEDAEAFWHDSVIDKETYGGVSIAWYKDGILYRFV